MRQERSLSRRRRHHPGRRLFGKKRSQAFLALCTGALLGQLARRLIQHGWVREPKGIRMTGCALHMSTEPEQHGLHTHHRPWDS